MIELTSRREETFPVPADELWKVVADFGAIGEWWPAGMLDRVEVDGRGVGMVRSIHTVIGIVLHEKLESIDHDARCLTLSIVGDLPVGMQDYRARGSVSGGADGGCTLTWEGHYRVPDPASETAARRFIEGAYGAMFGGLRDRVTRGAGSLTEVQVTEDLPLPAAKVWELVRDFDGAQKWLGGMVRKLEMEGRGVGAIRTITLPGDVLLHERLEAFDDDAMTFRYAIVRESPLPVRDYLATFKLTDLGGDRCRIEWGSTFDAMGLPDEKAKPMIAGIYTSGIAQLRATLGV